MSDAAPKSIERTVRWAVVAQLLLAVGVTLTAVIMFLLYSRTIDGLTESRDAIERLVEAKGEVLSAETAVRGYTITRDATFLQPYTDAGPRMDRLLGLMLRDGGPDERRATEALATVWSDWRIQFADRLLGHLASGDSSAALALLRSAEGKRRTDRIRRLVDDRVAIERAEISDGERTLRAIFAEALVALSVAITLIMLGTLLVRRRLRRHVLAPLTELADTARRFGEGDTSVRFADDPLEELAPLTTAFNDMAADVERSIVALRELDELKTHFVAAVSHELRTPLTSIKGYVEELMIGEVGPLNEEQEECARIAYRNADRLEKLIDDLLMLSRLESDRVEMKTGSVDLARQAAQLVRDLSPAAAKGQVRLTSDLPDQEVVIGDAERIRQTMANVLSNAIKFTGPGGTVRVSVAGGPEQVTVEIEDTGVGIPQAELARIGERFYRASTVGTVSGTGLGLAISREIVERHGGRLEIESEEGTGSLFRIVLPRKEGATKAL